jgi:hypothetical protein
MKPKIDFIHQFYQNISSKKDQTVKIKAQQTMDTTYLKKWYPL